MPAYPLSAIGDGDIQAQIELSEAVAVPGERIKIPIRITNSVNIDEVGLDSYTMTVRFNKTLLYPLHPTPTGAVTGRYRTVTIDGRRNGITNGEIGMLEFIAALGDTTATILDIIDFTWNEGKATTHLVNGLVKINPLGGWGLYLSTGQLRLMPLQPNPTSGPALITYETIEPGRTKLYLINMAGERTAMLVDGEQTANVYQLPFDPAGHGSGGYFLVLETPSGRVTQPVQIEH